MEILYEYLAVAVESNLPPQVFSAAKALFRRGQAVQSPSWMQSLCCSILWSFVACGICRGFSI